MSETLELSRATIEAIADSVVEKQSILRRPELTLDEAIAYTGFRSASAFFRWCGKKGVRPIDRGRYRRARLDTAMGGVR